MISKAASNGGLSVFRSRPRFKRQIRWTFPAPATKIKTVLHEPTAAKQSEQGGRATLPGSQRGLGTPGLQEKYQLARTGSPKGTVQPQPPPQPGARARTAL